MQQNGLYNYKNLKHYGEFSSNKILKSRWNGAFSLNIQTVKAFSSGR